MEDILNSFLGNVTRKINGDTLNGDSSRKKIQFH